MLNGSITPSSSDADLRVSLTEVTASERPQYEDDEFFSIISTEVTHSEGLQSEDAEFLSIIPTEVPHSESARYSNSNSKIVFHRARYEADKRVFKAQLDELVTARERPQYEDADKLVFQAQLDDKQDDEIEKYKKEINLRRDLDAIQTNNMKIQDDEIEKYKKEIVELKESNVSLRQDLDAIQTNMLKTQDDEIEKYKKEIVELKELNVSLRQDLDAIQTNMLKTQQEAQYASSEESLMTLVPEENIRLVLFAVDATENSRMAFEWYMKNLFRKHDTIVIVHVVKPSKKTEPMVFLEEDVAKYKESQKVVGVYTRFCEKNKIKYSVEILNKDKPGEEIIRIAERKSINIIVMGTRGINTWNKLNNSSVSDYVVSKAAIPVVMIPGTKMRTV